MDSYSFDIFADYNQIFFHKIQLKPGSGYYAVLVLCNGLNTLSNAGNKAQNIPSTHYHTYEWEPGKIPMETGSHLDGEYNP